MVLLHSQPNELQSISDKFSLKHSELRCEVQKLFQNSQAGCIHKQRL